MTQAIDRAVQLLRDGALVAFPTETVYGLGADASQPEAVAKIFIAKDRPATVPLTIHIGPNADPSHWAHLTADAQTLMDAFWPGPLTLILPKTENVPDIVVAQGPTVGLRMPSHPLCMQLLDAFGGGVAAPSANRHRNLSPTCAEHVREDFGTSLPMILDGGSTTVGLESTVLLMVSEQPKILRLGAISRIQLESVLNKPVWVPETPGRSYALGQRIQCMPRSEWDGVIPADKRTAVLSFSEYQRDGVTVITMPEGPEAYQRALFGALREVERTDYDLILIEPIPDGPDWEAIQNRLDKLT